MGQGKFLNQKLGKSLSRKVELLKSVITGRTHHEPPNYLVKPPFPKKKGNSRDKP